MTASVGAPLTEAAATAEGAGAALAASAGDPGLAQVATDFAQIATRALRNGALVADLIGRGLSSGAGAYVRTDQAAMPINGR